MADDEQSTVHFTNGTEIIVQGAHSQVATQLRGDFPVIFTDAAKRPVWIQPQQVTHITPF